MNKTWKMRKTQRWEKTWNDLFMKLDQDIFTYLFIPTAKKLKVSTSSIKVTCKWPKIYMNSSVDNQWGKKHEWYIWGRYYALEDEILNSGRLNKLCWKEEKSQAKYSLTNEFMHLHSDWFSFACAQKSTWWSLFNWNMKIC